MNKKDMAKELIRNNTGLLACPHCGGNLQVTGLYALVCPNRHNFDMAASGYINLLTRAVKAEYGADMLEARNKVCRSGFFDGLLAVLADVISSRCKPVNHEPLLILDAGCGEGSQLARLLSMLRDGTSRAATGIGVDISKEGIRIAARDYPGVLWLAADLAKLPIADGKLDAIINVLSPSNYAEFGRVLKPGGLLVKAVPGDGYLKELRQAFYEDERQEYSGERVRTHFEERFTVVDSRQVKYAVNVEGEDLKNLIKMTPLSWRAAEEKMNSVLNMGRMESTVDFTVLVGMEMPDRMEEGK
jgi:23S rRNA (guanine745-N1)-methyltransferase